MTLDEFINETSPITSIENLTGSEQFIRLCKDESIIYLPVTGTQFRETLSEVLADNDKFILSFFKASQRFNLTIF